MTAIFTIFLAKLFTPIAIGIGIAGAFVSRNWWHVLVTAVIAALVSEYFLSMAIADYAFEVLPFVITIIASAIWAAWFYWLALARRTGK